MVRTRKLRKQRIEPEDDFEYVDRKKVVGFYPHCVTPQLALAEAKQYDEIYALAHHPVRGEEEYEA